MNAAAGPDGSDGAGDLGERLADAELLPVGDQPIDHALRRAAGARVLGIVGGDGSINAAAKDALETHRPLAVFPGGTLNHFARDLGVDGPEATISALRAGEVVAVDVGTIDGEPFLNTASFGSYAELVDVREKLERRLGKWPALLIAAAVVLRRAKPVPVELDGRLQRVWMIFIGNCEYQPPGFAPTRRERLDDGLLDVRVVAECARWSRLRFLGALATRRLDRSRVCSRSLLQSLHVHSLDGPLRLARDGETFDGGVDVRVAKHPERLVVYAPHEPLPGRDG